MNRKILWAVAALCVGLVTGCGAARPSKYYQLTVPGGTQTAAAGSAYNVSLLIGPLRASHLYRENHIVYSSGAEQMGTYEYQLWSEPPTELLAEVLMRQLNASGRYRSVDFQRSNSRGDYVLFGRLYDFKEISGPPLLARLSIELEMRNVKTGATVWTHYYSHDEPVTGKAITDVVAALDSNAQHAAGDIMASLDQYFSAHPAD